MARSKRSFGSIRKLPSGRYQAVYTGPDTRIHKADRTFVAKVDAEGWLVDRQREISRGEWTAKRADAKRHTLTFGTYADRWLEHRTLKPRTRAHYRSLLDKELLPTFGTMPIRAIDADDVRDWYHLMGNSRPTLRSHAYGLLRTIMGSATQDRVLEHNPVHIRGAGRTKRVKQIKPATLDELAKLVEAMPENLKLMVLLAAWCALRFGELAELRRRDVDAKAGVIHVRLGVTRIKGEVIVGRPKTDSSIRDVSIPPHLIPMIKTHLREHAAWGQDGLLFPAGHGGNLAPSTLYRHYYPARQAAGREDLRFHDLRHTGATLAAATGASLAELMHRLGHSTAAASLRYQHVAQARDAEIAKALSRMAEPE